MATSFGAVVLIGAGRMGGALLKGWLAGGRFSDIHVVEPNPSAAIQALAEQEKIVLTDRLGGDGTFAAIVLAIKPQVLPQALKESSTLLRAAGETNALCLSIAAGVTSGFLAEHAGFGARIVRAMPNTPGAIGRGITALYGTRALSSGDRVMAEALMAVLGETLWLEDEALMDAVTAVSGSGPAYVFLLAEALAAAGMVQGLDAATAEKLARATVAGAGALLAADARAPAQLRQEVTSPGGTTEAALKVLMGSGGMEELMRRAVDAAAKRSKELGS